jgi:hypothetical protein
VTAVAQRRQQRIDHLDPHERLVAQQHQHGLRPFRQRRHPDAQRARESGGGVGVAHATFTAPRDRGPDLPGRVAEHDHDVAEPGRRRSVEDSLEQRLPAQPRQGLDAPEPFGRAGGQDERGDPPPIHLSRRKQPGRWAVPGPAPWALPPCAVGRSTG